VITFKKKAEELQEIVKQLPLDRILIETDAPFISPEPYRGRRNEPLYVKYVARKIAELKNISYEEVTEATTANAKTIFNIPRIYK
ncbi:MAG TPA: TatD family hydrolase, partial [Patescibacteria group bacterium]|nr:TatD family hydrolase [Patescibacteria group bacterium]